jgi:MoxR-like ATPase
MAQFDSSDIGSWSGTGAVVLYQGGFRVRFTNLTHDRNYRTVRTVEHYRPGNLDCASAMPERGHNRRGARECTEACRPVIRIPLSWNTRSEWDINGSASEIFPTFGSMESVAREAWHHANVPYRLHRYSERSSVVWPRNVNAQSTTPEPAPAAQEAPQAVTMAEALGHCGWTVFANLVEMIAKLASIELAENATLEAALTQASAPSDPYTVATVLAYLKARDHKGHTIPLALAGPTGCGKTTIAEQAADALGLPFYTDSFNSDMSVDDLLGSKELTTEGTTYAPSAFIEAYENGGVYCADEIDASDENTLLALNRALANGSCPVPNRVGNRMARRHPNFYCIAGANTFGGGADRVYVGRNQLDKASRDRFHWVGWDYSLTYEATIIAGAPAHVQRDLAKFRDSIRAMLTTTAVREVFSTRTLSNWTAYTHAGLTLDTLARDYFASWSRNDLQTARQAHVPFVPANS